MSLILKRIELNNIRSHKHLVFEPSTMGVTAISGPNGSGKSTIVDSIAWLLYGSKPQGVSKAISILREGADLKNEKCFAEAEIELEQSTLKVQRRIVNKHGAVECEVWEMKHDEDDWEQIAGPAVSHAESYIKKRLKMDEKGFLAAILVQQKQVDQLIAASPRERAEVIEKLTGISSITAALVEARQQYNVLRRTLQYTSLDEEGLEELKKERTSLEKEISTSTNKHNALKKEIEDLDENLEALQEKIADDEKKEAEVLSLKEGKATATATIATLEEQLQELTGLREEKKKQLTLANKGGDLKLVEEKLRNLKTDLRKKDKVDNDLTRDINHWKEKLALYEDVIEKSSVKELAPAQEGLAKALAKKDALQRKGIKLSSDKAGLLSQASTIQNAIKVITGSDGTCPTCLQHVEDTDKAVLVLEKERASYLDSAENINSQLAALERNKTGNEEAINKFSTLVESISSLEEVKTTLITLAEGKNEVEGVVLALEKEITAVEKQYNSLKQQESVKNEYERLRSRSVIVSDKLEKEKAALQKCTALLKGYSTNSNTLGSLRKKFSTASTSRSDKYSLYSEIREVLSVSTLKLSHLEEKITAEEAAIAKYKDLMQSVEASGSSVDIIEEFRENRIKTSVPIVGAYASDLLSRFTEGKFTQLKLDEKFNATVMLANGTERAVGLLSGGELSAAAISLRLAISMLLNSGSSQNMIILDEVLVSQDAPRAEQILTTIKDVCQGQVLMISHGPYTNEIADKVVEL